MSLISDALRKAQVETAQRDRVQHRFYVAHGGRAAVAHPGVSRAMIVLAAVVGGSITAGALLFQFAATTKPQTKPADRVVANVQAAPAPAPVPVAVAAVEQPAPVVVRPPKARRVASPPPAPPPREASPSKRDSFVSGETYASPIQGPLGTSLTLSGISRSRGDSVAIINGSLIRAGGNVGPFVVEEIEPRRVRVRYVDVSFWVTY